MKRTLFVLAAAALLALYAAAGAERFTGAGGILKLEVPAGVTAREAGDGTVYLYPGTAPVIPYVTAFGLEGTADTDGFIRRMSASIAASLGEGAGFKALCEPYEVIFGGRTTSCVAFSYTVKGAPLLDTRFVLMENGHTYVFSLVEAYDGESELAWLVREAIMGLGAAKRLFSSSAPAFTAMIPEDTAASVSADAGIVTLYAGEKGVYPFVTVSGFAGYEDPEAFLDSYTRVMAGKFAENGLEASETLQTAFSGRQAAYKCFYYAINGREIEQYTFALRAGEGIYLISGLSVPAEYLNARTLLNSVLESFAVPGG